MNFDLIELRRVQVQMKAKDFLKVCSGLVNVCDTTGRLMQTLLHFYTHSNG